MSSLFRNKRLIFLIILIFLLLCLAVWLLGFQNKKEVQPSLFFAQPTLLPTSLPTFLPTLLPSLFPSPEKFGPKVSLKILKDVGETYLDHFGLQEADFKRIAAAGFDVVAGNFDICAYSEDVTYLLDQAHQNGLRVILPAGSGEAEWGYECEKKYQKTQPPVWQKQKVVDWVRRYRNHPALFGWDTSNEAGGNFPHAEDSDIRVSLSQLQTAYQDVKNADPGHPVMIRINGWFFYDQDGNFFSPANPFGGGVADLVMVNAYSNVEDYFPDFVSTVMSRASQSIAGIDPKVKLIAALGVWEEPPLWYNPSVAQLENDLNQLKKISGLYGVAFFKYGARGSQWYLPEDVPELWENISSQI